MTLIGSLLGFQGRDIFTAVTLQKLWRYKQGQGSVKVIENVTIQKKLWRYKPGQGSVKVIENVTTQLFFEWWHFQWPSRTLDPVCNVTAFFEVKYLKNGAS